MSMETELPVLAFEDARRIYTSGFYDVPQDGVCEWAGKRYRFEQIPAADHRTTVYFLIDLNAEQWQFLDDLHASFEKYVGEHSNNPPGPQRPHELHQKHFGNPRFWPADNWPDLSGPIVAVWDWDKHVDGGTS